ncbi:hypothetical protein [Nitrosopumilus sp.]|uniref:hypothetical protein n=1 Tax=Nitrosopumilus sp. TaxID=2024843 RepID=UPI00247C6101|nr:hypothetical protein [Nitrosopumilus sp.]MCV0430684.1 hypothetical protein [Nitrosopumilus sp.]
MTLFYGNVFALSDPILISISPEMKNIVLDGKWTFFSEWKPTSLSYIVNDDKQIILRTAHYENFIYIFIDSVNDFTLDHELDTAIICFDGENNKNKIPDQNDFCFLSTLGNSHGIIYQGNSTNVHSNYFQKISASSNFIAISTVSDENDRYTDIPHPGFEFKIPTDIIQRSDNYGFFVSVYDSSSNIFFTYPEILQDDISVIPSPQKWGDLISPDKSLPELHYPIMIFLIVMSSLIIFQSKLSIAKF